MTRVAPETAPSAIQSSVQFPHRSEDMSTAIDTNWISGCITVALALLIFRYRGVDIRATAAANWSAMVAFGLGQADFRRVDV